MKTDDDEEDLTRRDTPGDQDLLQSSAADDAGDQARLTVDDIDQIVEGMDHFIISGDPDVEEVWQPFLDKLALLRADLRVLDTARQILDETICECAHLDGEHAFVNPESNDVADCHGNDPPGFGNCGCKTFRPVAFVVTIAAPPAPDPQLAHLASAMKKVLPPDLLAEVIAHLDPLTPFLKAIRDRAEGDNEPSDHLVDVRGGQR